MKVFLIVAVLLIGVYSLIKKIIIYNLATYFNSIIKNSYIIVLKLKKIGMQELHVVDAGMGWVVSVHSMSGQQIPPLPP